MFCTGLDIQIVTGAFFTQIHHSQLQSTVAYFPGIELPIRHITLILIIGPDHLVLPVFLIEGIEIIKKIHLPDIGRFLAHFIFLFDFFTAKY